MIDYSLAGLMALSCIPACASEAQKEDFGQWASNVLHQIYGDTSGWHDGNTGLAIPAGSAISAVNMGGAWPQVMVNE